MSPYKYGVAARHSHQLLPLSTNILAMSWNPNQSSYGVTEWNAYGPNGMWNMMSMFPGLLAGAGMSHPGYMYPGAGYQGSSMSHTAGLPHPAALPHSSALNPAAALQRHLVPAAETSPPLSPSAAMYKPPSPHAGVDPTTYVPVTPPHSPTSATLDQRFAYPLPAAQVAPRSVVPTQPFVGAPGIAALPGREPMAAPPLGTTVVDVPTRDENGRKLPRWMIKRAMCTICSKRFESRHKLQLHLYSHTGERPHECEVCGMRFARKFCYKRHLKTHSASRPHVCPRCGRGFREKYDMETHMMTEVCLKQAKGDHLSRHSHV
ncbi:zinc finger protein 775-like [Penaeus monodon]|uniref:zinc finger protein 775-like n=1 Tax=Penaeus monodon TaxID=6687 RepID=UPI0018A72550|nr:zinc finger protein 775-like [Penaeus monodon]